MKTPPIPKFQKIIEEVKGNQSFLPDQSSKVGLNELDKEREGFELDRDRKDQKAREGFQIAIFRFVMVYVAVVLVIVILQGFGSLIHFKLETTELVALLTTTTANILALLFIVIKYLFYREFK